MNIYQEFVQQGLGNLQRGGVQPTTALKTWYSRFILVFTIPQAVLLLVLAVNKEFKCIQDLESILESIVSGEVYLIMVIVQLSQRKAWQDLLKKIEDFWPIDINGTEQENLLRKQLRNNMRLCKVLDYMTLFDGAFYSLVPILLQQGKKLPFDVLIPMDSDLVYYLLYASHIHMFFSILNVVYGTYALNWGLVTIIGVQYDLLKQYFEDIDLDGSCRVRSKIKNFVNHHNFVDKFSDDVSKVNNIFMLNQFGALLFFEISLLLASLSSDSLVYQIRSYLLAITVTLLQFVACYTGQTIYDKSQNMAVGIYNSKWYVSNNKDIQFATKFILMYAFTRPKKMSSFGVLTANYETFVAICKLTYSIYTVFLSLQGSE